MENPDLDIRYLLPDKIEEFTNGLARDNVYDYLYDARLGIWLSFFISWSKKSGAGSQRLSMNQTIRQPQ